MLLKTAGVGPVAIPPDADAVIVRGFHAQPGVQALINQRMLGLKQQNFGQDRITGVTHPPTHRHPPVAFQR
jgi:hypothetical protein